MQASAFGIETLPRPRLLYSAEGTHIARFALDGFIVFVHYEATEERTEIHVRERDPDGSVRTARPRISVIHIADGPAWTEIGSSGGPLDGVDFDAFTDRLDVAAWLAGNREARLALIQETLVAAGRVMRGEEVAG